MSTVFAGVVSAVVAVLQAAPAVSAHIDRARRRVLPESFDTAVLVQIRQAEVERGMGQGTHCIWATQISVECYARGSAAQSPDVAVDALLESVVGRVLADPSLGGVVGDVGLVGVAYDFDVDGKATACATVTFNVRHVSAAASIS